MKRDDIVYDWNKQSPSLKPTHAYDFFDESLRDGVQSPSVVDPDIEDKLRILELMDSLGIQSADIGLPGAGKRAFDDVVTMLKFAQKKKLKIEMNAAGRTVVQDIRSIAEASQKAGMKLGVYAFIGSSPIRMWAENWDLEFIRKTSEETIRFAVKEGLDMAYVTEDTIRSAPAALSVLFKSAIDAGAKRLVLCDTVGHGTPDGVQALVRWTRSLINVHNPAVKIDWHGHNDRGLAVTNAIAALEVGAQRLHGCGLGIGERVGNTSMDQMLLNLKLLGWIDNDLSHLVEYVNTLSKATNVAIPVNYPLCGEDAFRTATGVHAAAIIKAKQKGDVWLADRVYSGVPAGEFGREQTIEIGHMSGMSNVRYWLAQRRVPATDELCKKILQHAKETSSVLTEQQVLAIIKPEKEKGTRSKAGLRKQHRRASARA